MTAGISLKNLQKSFKSQKKGAAGFVLHNITLSFSPGEIVGIFGKNGSGKTTLLSTIAGIYAPDRGSVEKEGFLIPLIGLQHALKERLSLKENIFLIGMLLGNKKKSLQEKLSEIISFAELNGYEDSQIYTFSQGMVARFIISLALHLNPKILLLDEATNVADAAFVNKCWEKIYRLAQKGTVVLLASHDISVLEKCGRFIWFHDGSVKKDGKSKDIMEEYARS
jgi:ABC-type polysaccharide/polyol phosphate transport system ATPase subunit